MQSILKKIFSKTVDGFSTYSCWTNICSGWYSKYYHIISCNPSAIRTTGKSQSINKKVYRPFKHQLAMFQAGSTVLQHIQEKASEYASEQAREPWCSQFIGQKPTLLGLFFFLEKISTSGGFQDQSAHINFLCGNVWVVATQICGIFTPDPWGNDPIWRAYFSNRLVQAPTT